MESKTLTANVDSAWLVDAAYDAGRVHLTLIRSSNQEPIRWSDPNYRPYYLTDTESSDTSVTKADLFTQEKRTLTKVTYNKLPPKKVRSWELDIDPALSYAYDQGLKFGTIHFFQENKWVPQAHLTPEQTSSFQKLFTDIKDRDPLKYRMLGDFYHCISQPIPKVDPAKLGLASSPDFEEEYYKAFLLSRVANLPITRTYKSRTVSDWIRSMLHTYYRTHDILIPNTAELKLGSTKKFVTGALTIAPTSGTYFDMVVLDFESLYPGVIDHYNLSYETIRCPHRGYENNLVPGLDYHVCLQKRGIYSALVGALRDLRVRHFKPLAKEAPRGAEEAKIASAGTRILKLFLVSSFGVTIRIHGLASPLLGEAITACGRHVLQSTWDLAQERSLRPRYGDTDSVFLDNPASNNLKEFVEEIGKNFGLELAYDRRYAVCVLSAAKKAYFGILPNGQPEIKGLTVAKSNSPRFFLETFQGCLAKLSEGKDSPENFEKAKQEAQTVVSDALQRLRHGRIPIEDLQFKVELREDPQAKFRAKALPQPYQAARLVSETGKKLNHGDTVGFVKVHPFKHKGRLFTVKPTIQASISDINYEDYVNSLIASLSQTFEPMGINLTRRTETKLSEFTRLD